MRYIIPIILVVISIGLFLKFTNPAYSDIKKDQVLVNQYNGILANGAELGKQRDTLRHTYDSIPTTSLDRLSALLPDNADNIHLVITLQQMAASYGLALSSIKFDAAPAAGTSTTGQSGATPPTAGNQQTYGTFNIEFTTTTTYDNFLKFTKDIESSLRLIDIQSVDFNAADPTKAETTFTVKLTTYWLKN